jgi:hypothetical protein
MQPWGAFGGDNIGIGYWQELYAVKTRTGHESRLLGIIEAEDGIRHARTLISRLRFQPLILD